MIERHIIHTRGTRDWQLAVCNDDVTASCHPVGGESIIYTTADFDLGARDRGRDNLSADHVVALYRKHAACEVSSDELLERVRAAIDEPTTEAPLA